MTNGLIQHIAVEESTRIQWVKIILRNVPGDTLSGDTLLLYIATVQLTSIIKQFESDNINFKVVPTFHGCV